MIRTTDVNYAATLIALGIGRISKAAPLDGGRLITFELTVSDEDMELAQELEQGYNDLELTLNRYRFVGSLSDFLDGIQRVRRAMRAVQR